MRFNFTNFFKKIRYKFKKISVKLDRNSDPLNETQKKAILIITKILMDPNCKFYINQLENKFYLKKFDGTNLHVFIVIQPIEKEYKITIIGKNLINKKIERFSYEIGLPINTGKKLINKFHKILRRSINKMENDILTENQTNLSQLVDILQIN